MQPSIATAWCVFITLFPSSCCPSFFFFFFFLCVYMCVCFDLLFVFVIISSSSSGAFSSLSLPPSPPPLSLSQGLVVRQVLTEPKLLTIRPVVNVVQTMPSTILYISFSNTSNSQKHNYALMVFVDFSSAFNTIQPHVLLEKMKVNNPFIIK